MSDAKIKEGVFIGPQIKKLLKGDAFEELMSADEAAAWNSFRLVVLCFLGNNKSRSYEKIVEDMLKNYAKIGANISICSHFHIVIIITNSHYTIKIGVNMFLKIHFLHSHLNFFPENLGKESDEHGERFHQQMKAVEKRYQGVWDEAMMGDYDWFLVRETNPRSYKRRSGIQNHF